MDKEQLKSKTQQFLTLDPVLTTALGSKLKPMTKPIYYVLSVILILMLLGSFVALFKGNFSVFLLELLLIVVNFVIVRMFCEYLNKD